MINNMDKYTRKIISTINYLAQTRDVDIMMERILTEARKITNADAGSIYKKESNMLQLKYAQNETKQKLAYTGRSHCVVSVSEL